MARKSTKSTSGSGAPADTKTRKTPAPKAAAPRRPKPAASKSENGDAGGSGRTLVIVESPKKARSINKFLGSGFVVKASMGHVRDLPKRRLGLDVANRYEPSYEIMPAKKDTIAELKREAAKADMVYLATDPDREGEAIAWHLQEALGLPDERVRRVMFHEITETRRQGGVQPRRPDQHGHGQRPAGAAVPRPVRRLSAQPAALEQGRPPPRAPAGSSRSPSA